MPPKLRESTLPNRQKPGHPKMPGFVVPQSSSSVCFFCFLKGGSIEPLRQYQAAFRSFGSGL
jgi:hypothetical protein